MSDALVVTTRPVDHVAVVMLNRPETLNALDGGLIEELDGSLQALAAEDDIHVVVLTGAGRGFCAGADFGILSVLAESDTTFELMKQVSRPVQTLHHLPQLTIAAVNGPAAGAGWGLVMACDIRIAAASARFGATFARMGLGPDYGLSKTLPQAVGRDRALELLMTARIIDADQASAIGAVSAVVDDVVADAVRLATEVARAPGRTVRSVKRTLRSAADADFDTAVGVIEARAQAELFNHPDFMDVARVWIAQVAGNAGPGHRPPVSP
ncbi:enoyl-CoA hydratase/isomerase family protein [Mycolicibacterium austroafricanum]|uniref:enoyl-CoA hydratase/isomerase family protein n=1 Tax=Mycolicibacterium austroafricanum TaxID=39687 RepID=UPI001CA32642|nr:enoyl-CoA hydratase/isomerase family protein [Mycolicibacterium austroafricanum]QZT61121.1 enoyl-CoA hydratase/isomerase family protein [Mycolicibacterium austroafricanum]